MQNNNNKSNIQVVCRIRNLSGKKAGCKRECIEMSGNAVMVKVQHVLQSLQLTIDQNSVFTFDRVFGVDASQIDIFEDIGKQMILGTVLLELLKYFISSQIY